MRSENKEWPNTLSISNRSLTPQAVDCIQRYGDIGNFAALFPPSKQAEYSKNLERLFLGTAPALSTVSVAYGSSSAEQWLAFQLIDLSEFAGCRDKLNTFQLHSLSQVITSQWGYLKVTELMYFFLMLKTGKYGRFYGSVDAMTITMALREFCQERLEILGDLERRNQAKRIEQQRSQRQEQEAEMYAACSVSNMTVYEFTVLVDDYGLTTQEIAEIGWLFRQDSLPGFDPKRLAFLKAIGYEPAKSGADNAESAVKSILGGMTVR